MKKRLKNAKIFIENPQKMKIGQKFKIPALLVFFYVSLRVCIQNFRVLAPTLMDLLVFF